MRAFWPIATFAMSASSTLTSVWILAGFAIVIRLEPGMFVELEMAVSPTLMSSDVTTPSIGEYTRVFVSRSCAWSSNARTCDSVSRLERRSTSAISRLFVEVVKRSSSISFMSCRLFMRSHCVRRFSTCSCWRWIAISCTRALAWFCSTAARSRWSSICSTSWPFVTRAPSSTKMAGHAADLLRRELHFLLVHELAGREHRRLDAAALDLLGLHLHGGAAAQARLDQRHGNHEHDDADDQQ